MYVAVQQRDGVAVVGKGQVTGEQLVQQGADGVDVRRRGQLPGQSLLRSDVGGSAQHLARPRGERLHASEHLGDAEVGHLQRSGRAEEQVLGLDVPVQDALAVGVVQGAAGGEDDAARRLGGHTLGRDAVPHRPAGEQLHHQQTELVLLDVVEDGDDVGVVERREQTGLARETSLHSRVGGERLRQLLDGNLAA